MKSLSIISILLCLVAYARATSYLIPIEQKFDYASIIAEVEILEVDPDPRPDDPTGYTVFTAKVLELFKGPSPSPLKFRGHAYAHIARDKLSGLIGQTFIVFIHDPYENKKYWLFEGPRGMRPLGDEYTEWRIEDGKIVTDVYTRTEYVTRLRAIDASKTIEISKPEKKKSLTRRWRQFR